MAVRRHPFLVAYWGPETLLLCNYVTGTTMAAEGNDLDILQLAAQWLPLDALERLAEARGCPSPGARIAALREFGALQEIDRPLTRRERATADWHNWGPAAAWFHQGTKDVAFAGPEATGRVAQRLYGPLAAAPTYEPKGTGDPIALDDFNQSATAVAPTLQARRTWRRFGPAPLRRVDLSTLLGLTWGVQHWMRASPTHRLPLKTSPSGGACHSIDCYLLALNVEGLDSGIYHYDADAHALRLVRSADRSDAVRYLHSQPAFAESAAIFFMAAVFPRVQWKYQIGRAYRIVLLEAGHLAQTFCLSATALGLAPFSTGAFADSELEADLGLDGATESVVYATGVGARPDSLSWAPFADGDAPATELPAWASRLRKRTS